jgi:lycopene cyclase domain-containing protein
MTGLWLLFLLERSSKALVSNPEYSDNDRRSRFWGAAFTLILTYFGAALLTVHWGTYLGLIFIWAGPVLAFQWIYGGHDLWRLKGVWFLGWMVPSLYLWIADRIAISQGIWFFSEYQISGIEILGLPLEEALFFLVTNMMVVQGLLLYQVTLGNWATKQKNKQGLKNFIHSKLHSLSVG